MSGHDIIVIGASAGGVDALRQIMAGLPGDLNAAVFVVLHIPATASSLLPEILTRAGQMEARHASDQEMIRPGRIYVAPPDYHLLVNYEYMRVVSGPRENHVRPAVDPLFRSAAVAYGPRVVGVVLSGGMDDGSAGLIAIKQRGGIAVVQDPREALHPSMPQSALENVSVDYCLPVAEIAGLLVQLSIAPAEDEEKYPIPQILEIESRIAQKEEGAMELINELGKPSTLTCPDCGGTLWEVHDGQMLRYRCHVGHAFSAGSLQSGQSEALEEAFFVALRTLNEQIALYQRMADRARAEQRMPLVNRLDEKVAQLKQHAATIKTILQGNEKLSGVSSA